MRVNRNRLRRIIREQVAELAVDPAAAAEVVAAPVEASLAESMAPEQEVMVEMELAARGLEQVAEALNAAAGACAECGDISSNAPILESMAIQAVALQEMVDAQADVLSENVDLPVVDAVVDAVSAVAPE
tara:strand:+ start:377 stop:766 length:390 start_codon:yes stop_codon:yes gene_type:complete